MDKLSFLKEKLKNELLEIFASAVVSGTEEALLKSCIKALSGVVVYLYDLSEEKRKEIEEKISEVIEEVINEKEKASF